MNILIISLKVILVISWLLTGKDILSLYKSDTGVTMKFDWLSWINISGTIGLTLVSLFAVIDSTAYVFTACLIAVAILMVFFLKARLVISGANKVLLGSHIMALRDIRKVYTGLMTLYVETKEKTYKIYAPVTDRTVTTLLYETAKGRRS